MCSLIESVYVYQLSTSNSNIKQHKSSKFSYIIVMARLICELLHLNLVGGDLLIGVRIKLLVRNLAGQ